MSVASRIRFGVFELDLRSGELFRQGTRIKLQNQMFQVLTALLEHPGEVIPRDALKHRIWPGDTFVDFDRGLNKAINGLRAVLRDSPKRPRYIETLSRRGYRFIGGVISPCQAVPARRGIDSIAVLPLESYCEDRAQEYFCDGLTQELITAVSRIRSLRVISRTSAMSYRGARKPLPVIADELRVDAAIEGSIVRSDQNMRITVNLVHARDETHLWSR